MNNKHIALEVSKDEHYRSPYLKSLKENWPSLARDYRHFCHAVNPQIGDVWVWTSPEGQKFYHLILDEKQADHDHIMHPERLQSFRKALKNLKRLLENENRNEQIEFPKVAFHFTDSEMNFANLIMKEAFLDTESSVSFI